MAETVEAGQIWRDKFGQVRVLAVAEGYAMLKRRRHNPFLAAVAQMQRGEYGWTLIGRRPVEASEVQHG